MKVLFVTGDDDFHALSFEEDHGGKNISDIIADPDSFQSDEYRLEVKEFGDVDPAFVAFIRKDIQDYDDSKTKTFYLETEVVRG